MDFQYLMLIVIGFGAQLIDGALGMAFGVIATSSLVATGISPTIASATIHAAEVATTAISGASHIWNGNVDRRLLLKLVITGMCGGVGGFLDAVGGWRLGTVGGLDIDGVWQQSAPHDRLGELGRILRDIEHFSGLPDAVGLRALW